MAHEDKGHYAEKHPGAVRDENICNALLNACSNNKITCSTVHRISGNLNADPETIGIQADLIELQLIECQLGLFGYEGDGKKINPHINILPELEIILNETSQDGRLSCFQCWEIATRLKLKKMDVASACEKLEIRIKPCQIGAF